ncbi:DNA-binding XRE family transcriptional regulator [Ochrobactrum sp. BH3]|nr:DNA-binding XRE family transcriptional regulator [Ochrobactrum sp. BH3]
MKMQVQFIKTPQGEEMAILPKADYEKLLDALEEKQDIEDVRRIKARIASGEEELIPSDIVDRLLDGESKIKVWREYRGMTGKTLADAAGMSAPYLSQIESGAREGSLDAMKKIADVLKVTIDDLI